jgi:hypothetical protein
MPRAVKSLISRCRGTADVFRLAGSTKPNVFRPHGRADTHSIAGPFSDRRVSSHHQGLPSSGFVCFFR